MPGRERGESMGTVKYVLLVDDETDFLFSARIALRKSGYRVEVAASGKEALFKILEAQDGKDPFDLLITDIRMPEMSGFDLIDAVKKCGIVTPFIAMTCFSDGELLRELKARDCEMVIEKPFPPEELVVQVRGVLTAGVGAIGLPGKDESA